MKRRLYVILLTTLSITTTTLRGQFAPSDSVRTDPKVRTGTLPNGLSYYVRKNTVPEKKVQLRLVVKAGSVLEDPDQLGLAHFMEHMNFNGLDGFPRNELVSYLNSVGVQLGADLNAYTDYNETVFILPVPSDNPAVVQKGFSILEGWAAHAILDSIEIDKERGVILEESRLRKGSFQRLRDQYLPRFLNGSLYAWRAPIGKDSIISTFRHDALRRFYKTWYRPDMMAVCVVGDLDPDTAVASIYSHFAGLTNPTPKVSWPAGTGVPPRAASEAMVLTDKEEISTTLRLVYRQEKYKPAKTWQQYRESVIEDLFLAMANRRLSDLAQQPGAPFSYAAAGFLSPVRGWRAFAFTTGPLDHSVTPSVTALASAFESIRQFGFLPAELRRAADNLLNNAEQDYLNEDKTDSRQIIRGYADNFLSGTPIPGYALRYKFLKTQLPDISLEEVNTEARRLYQPDQLFLLVTAPAKDSALLPDDRQALAVVTKAESMPAKPYTETPVAALKARPLAGGKILSRKTDATLGTTDLVLSNGVTITLKPTDFKKGEIQMDGWRPGGYHQFPLADKPSAVNAAKLVNSMGIEDNGPGQLLKLLAGKPITIEPYLNADEEGVQGATSEKELPAFLQLVYLSLTHPRKDTAIGNLYIAALQSIMGNLKSDPTAYFMDSIRRLVYANNPWCSNTILTNNELQQVSVNRAYAIYRKVFASADGLHFTFVGDFNLDSIQPRLAYWLGGLPSTRVPHRFTDVQLRPEKGIVKTTLYKGLDKKSRIEIQFNGEFPYSQEEDLRLKAVAALLNIKVIEVMREQMSAIYGGGFSVKLYKHPYENYSIVATFYCAPENVDTLIKSMFNIISKVKDAGPDPRDVAKVKEILLKQNEDHLKDNDYWLESLSNAWIDGQPAAWINRYADKVSALDAADIRATVRKYFRLDNYVQAVLNPEPARKQ